ncbi:hypothetical protein JHK82_056236 [Glycine max]|uniref:Uncharacterized protein n=1 Tax=Glycine max TaxID=3847 RepID=A0A0R0EAH3_SOYBN|nr:hypothetical protein JHK86_056064 [Glycine max]KAG4910211.1 hypothetical protein JHK87_056327 [Glycine soja]KAG4918809.1 hypothetical protein JHK85_057090 [Glycine max]KAG5074882.1 hypothetical protein JHK84_056113 [Glycine max]KAG5077541.1 hypothetical protein JHK82_056236 [Glycine max]
MPDPKSPPQAAFRFACPKISHAFCYLIFKHPPLPFLVLSKHAYPPPSFSLSDTILTQKP